MSEYYTDYVWRNGIPYGKGKIAEPIGLYYKLPMDPYRKRIAIEQYQDKAFQRVIYDSAFIDFRHLKPPAEQTAWQKIVISSSPTRVMSIIRNQDDRIVCMEECLFDGNYCIECRLTSPHGFLLSIHKMSYRALGHPFDGVVLYDSNEHPVMSKKYAIEEDSGEFGELLEEAWEDVPVS